MAQPPHGPKGKPRPIALTILLTIATLGIFSFFWVYATQKEIKEYSGIGLGGGLGLLVYFFASPATWFLIPHDISQLTSRAGMASRVSAITGLWILLPVLGPFIWFHKVQTQLNEFWPAAP